MAKFTTLAVALEYLNNYLCDCYLFDIYLKMNDLHLQHQDDLSVGLDSTPYNRALLLHKNGRRSMEKGNYFEALNKLLEVKQLFIENSPPTDGLVLELSTLYDNIASNYFSSTDYLPALTMCK
ncbi:unnamed protein product [Adineta steineri]|uniref:Uncharacterized protein n=1 Tax=Adineta steineri TaxID=433720 RepID=A0A819MFA6_9BILA|nr:unnamed protein product [Adineta steineri]